MKILGMLVFMGSLLIASGAAAGPVVREAAGANAAAIQAVVDSLPCRPRRGE